MQKKSERRKKRPRDDEASTEGTLPMDSDSFHPEMSADPSDGVAVIPAVTPAMMDHAAHRAAELADGVAHGTPAVIQDTPAEFQERAAQESATQESEAAPSPGEPVAETSQAQPATALASIDNAAVDGAGDALDAGLGTLWAAGEDLAEAARTLPVTADALARYHAKLVAFTQSNMAATGELLSALMVAKSFPEAVALNADHLRRRMDVMTLQGRELAALAQTLAFEALGPFKNVIAPGMSGKGPRVL